MTVSREYNNGARARVPDNSDELEAARKELIEEDSAGSSESAVEVTVGGEVQLECPSGPSTAIPCWAKTGSDSELQPIGPGSNLRIEQALYQEAGEYKCIVGGKNENLEKLRVYTLHLNVVGQYRCLFFVLTYSSRLLSPLYCIYSKIIDRLKHGFVRDFLTETQTYALDDKNVN